MSRDGPKGSQRINANVSPTAPAVEDPRAPPLLGWIVEDTQRHPHGSRSVTEMKPALRRLDALGRSIERYGIGQWRKPYARTGSAAARS